MTMPSEEGLATCEVLEEFLDNVHQVQLLPPVAPVQVRVRELLLIWGLCSIFGPIFGFIFGFGRFIFAFLVLEV